MEVSMSSSPQSIPTSATPSNLSPPPSTLAQSPTQTQTQLQFSPGQKRPAQDVDASATPTQTTRNDTNSIPNYIANKENRDIMEAKVEPSLSLPMSLPIQTTMGAQNLPGASVVMGKGSPPAGGGSSGAPASSKKRKLSPASQQAKQQEKEAKERQRLEEKAKKDEEKAKREEERVKKEEEKRKRDFEREEERKKREEKKKAKDEEKAVKDEEKRKKEEEKMKKARAQTSLSSFFTKPKATPTKPPSSASDSPKKLPDDGSSASTSENAGDMSAYKRSFPDFFLQSHTVIAPPHRFERDAQAIAHLQANVDSYLTSPSVNEAPAFRPSELFKLMHYQRRRGLQKMSVREILLQMQSMHDVPETSEAARKLQASLKQVRMKSLRFGEDVRPPYQGTFTRSVPIDTASRVMRNPFRRELPQVDYDYDSEAEWEEPEEGEELDSEEEDEGSEEGDDDMDGFLDDEEDQLLDGRRRQLVGDLEPVSTGIKWQDQGPAPELQKYKIEMILPGVTFPIDPFSSSYWQKPKAAEPGHNNALGRGTVHYFVGNPAQHAAGPLAMQDGSTVAAGRAKRAFPTDQLGEFRTVVEGSDLTKTGLIEILKKRFPKVSKDTLKATLDSTAKRVGQKEAEKKWVCM